MNFVYNTEKGLLKGKIMGSYGPPPKRYLYFKKIPRNPDAKTDRWKIESHKGVHLGFIRFYPQWRCYVAESAAGTVWSCECDKERSDFTRALTEEWRESKRKNRKKKE
jgi:hypothetical protein